MRLKHMYGHFKPAREWSPVESSLDPTSLVSMPACLKRLSRPAPKTPLSAQGTEHGLELVMLYVCLQRQIALLEIAVCHALALHCAVVATENLL